MAMPQPHQLCHILSVDLVQIFRIDCAVLAALSYDFDRPAHYNIDRSPIRHQSNIVVKDPSSVEQWYGESHQLLHYELSFVHPRMLFAVNLVIQIVLSKCESRHQVSTHPDGKFDE